MIIKSLTRKNESYSQLIRYMLQDSKDLSELANKSFIIRNHIKSDTIEDIAQEFKQNEQFRIHKRLNNSKIHHTILSFSDKDQDRLTLEKIKTLTQAYIRLRSPNGMALAVPHTDKNSWHCHIMFSGVEYRTGKSIRISREEFKALKIQIQDIQIDRFPELTGSVVEHNRESKSIGIDFNQKWATDKIALKGIIDTSFNEAISKDDFYKHLKAHHIEKYERSGATAGVRYNGRKYRFRTLGYTREQLLEIDKEQARLRELELQRSISDQRTVEHDR